MFIPFLKKNTYIYEKINLGPTINYKKSYALTPNIKILLFLTARVQ